MTVLSKDHRKILGTAILAARRAAEKGAKDALEYLAVPASKFHDSMSEEQRDLRRKLRARGRQLGDKRDLDGAQSVNRLTHEIAYEQWHRMLFARFLAENNLLIHPEVGVAVSLEEIKEFAREQGIEAKDLAAQYAQHSLPQIFRSGDPVLEVTLAKEIRVELDKLLISLPTEIFLADDSLGWTYQYWQSDKKDAVNESGNKIGADELPAVTQLFTEHYMVLFLYHNTIGAWHAGKVLAENPSLAETAKSEEELRQAVKLNAKGGYDFEYLRFVREAKEGDEDDQPTGPWRPAGGTFEGWPKIAKELKVLDPCCGSGHFLTEGFEILVRLRMDEEGLGLDEAICAVFTDNLYGLELDPRCTQIAAFNVGLTAWKLSGKLLELPPLHIACSGMAVGASKDDWVKLAGDDSKLKYGMEQLYDLFEQASELGSLIDPNAIEGDVYTANFTELKPLFEKAMAQEKSDAEGEERAIAAHGMARAAELLANEYTLAITNVPYLGQRDQCDELRAFAKEHYKLSKADLATMFLERMLNQVGRYGTVSTVTPQNWLFLARYGKLREKILKQRTWESVARLGAQAFQTPMWDFNVMLLSVSAPKAPKGHAMTGVDVASLRPASAKADLLYTQTVESQLQSEQLEKPNFAINFEPLSTLPPLSDYAYCHQGASTVDIIRFRRCQWELNSCHDWNYHLSTPSGLTEFSGYSYLTGVRDVGSEMYATAMHLKDLGTLGGWLSGQKVWSQRGISCSWMNTLPATIYSGCVYDNMAATVVAKDEDFLAPIWCFMSSTEYNAEVRKISQKLQVANATLVKVPFDLDHWQKVADEKYPNGLPEPYSWDPTQWLFHGHPAKADVETVLQVAVGRLLDYQWPPELDPEMRLSDEAREWVAKCEPLNDFADEDGIVCLFATNNEKPADERLRELLAAAFGSEWSPAKERELLEAAGVTTTLDVWLRDKFFEHHCKLFKHRPFVWHIWDGNRSGFHCLVNAHKLSGDAGEGRRTLETITFTYLGDWIERQKADVAAGKEGAEAHLAAAQDLQAQLKKILEGEPPYDIFVRWKAINEQAMGWDPDINDGVRLNIRPFMKAELQTGGKKGAGLLRWKPNIHWKKDRGKEPMSLRPRAEYPWFWGCDDSGSLEECTDVTGTVDFDGNRWNDLHCSITAKQQVRVEEKVS